MSSKLAMSLDDIIKKDKGLNKRIKRENTTKNDRSRSSGPKRLGRTKGKGAGIYKKPQRPGKEGKGKFANSRKPLRQAGRSRKPEGRPQSSRFQRVRAYSQ